MRARLKGVMVHLVKVTPVHIGLDIILFYTLTHHTSVMPKLQPAIASQDPKTDQM